MAPENANDHYGSGLDHPPTDTEPVSIAEAARRLQITKNAVIQRRKRGSLYSRHDGKRWLVWIPTDAGVTGRDPVRPGGDQPPPTTPTTADDHPGGRDISGIVGMLDRALRENADLRVTAALMQERNRVLEERLLALESGARSADDQQPDTEHPAERVAEPPGTRSVSGTTSDTPTSHRGRVARWFRERTGR